jgi:hypothetical protein
MDFTFGIITDGNNENRINFIIDSIEKENIPNYEIILVGGNNIIRNNVVHIPFDETIKPKWITRKKNLITENAKYENIVYMHDYVYLEDDWYNGYLKFGNDFDVCMNVIKNTDDSRFRDWTLWADLSNMKDVISPEDVKYLENNRTFLLPYDMSHLTKYMYISGAYWVVKRNIMIETPLDENLIWGESEDVVWSKIVREKYNFKMNPYSSVKFMKMKSISEFYEINDKSKEILNKLIINFTFGIITGGGNIDMIKKIIHSIEKQNIPHYEIIIVGGESIIHKNVIHIPFNETIKPKWITRKKNLITQHAKYKNIVYMHDYVYLDDNWYSGYCKNGVNFNACTNIIKNLDGTRYRDWNLEFVIQKKLPIGYRFLLPYDMTHLSKWMYFSGAYFVAKKIIMEELPLNENRVWGQGEDVEWSQIYRRKYKFSINSYSTVHLMIQHDVVFSEVNDDDIIKLNNIDPNEDSDLYLYGRR